MCIVNLVTGIFAGVYETGLEMNGYDPLLDTLQPVGVINWLYFIKYAVPVIEYGIIILILFFMNLEKHLPDMQKEIRARYKAAAEARGEVWVSPEELEEREREENARLAEKARIDDLKEKCEKRGLDFDAENQKYLDKKAKKEKK
jgi:GPH family glycoside/pentoside/hexuronide:cation symporter